MNATYREGHQSSSKLILDGLLSDLQVIYTDIHANPELSMQGTRTAGLFAKRLRTLGFELTVEIGRTGVVGVLRNGKGPTIMLRADMGPLPVQEATDLPYASNANVG